MDRAARLRKRGSLQARDRQTISKATGERLFSVPNFLELIQTNNNTINSIYPPRLRSLFASFFLSLSFFKIF
jgi:hypothetical protein